jgi:general secretion pathway protein D
MLAGCAATTTSRAAHDAEFQREYDLAVVEYTKLVRMKPNDTNARLGLERAKLRASQEHFERGLRQASVGKLEEALIEYEMAAELNPANAAVDEELRATRTKLRTKVAVSREGKTELETLVCRPT